jgi:hypothetical protein
VETGEVLPPDPTQLANLLKVTQPKLAELWWRARERNTNIPHDSDSPVPDQPGDA